MGYRSCVAMMLYGEPSKVDIVDALLLQRLSDEYDRELFERVKQTHEEKGERCVLWTFDNIKWYDDLDHYRDKLFGWVTEIMEQRNKEATEEKWWIACEFVRVGEDTDDIDTQYSYDADYRLGIERTINIPSNFKWRD